MEPTNFPRLMVVFFLLSAYGWGRLCRLFCDRRLFRFHTFSMVFGLALLNVVGGILNSLGLARSIVLLTLMAVGALLAGFELLRTRPWLHCRLSKQQMPMLVAGGCAVAAVLLLVPATVFNIYDDFHTYAVRAVRMSQTGSLGGNAFDPLGLDSLGSQSFFHGFFLSGADIRMLNGFDAVACFTLCVLLAAELSVRWRLPWIAGTMVVLCTVFINPQYVNISPLYSGVAAVMAVVVCGMLVGRSLASERDRKHWRVDLSLALMVAWLVTLKITLALFGALFLTLLYLFLLLRGCDRQTTLWSALTVSGVAGLLVVPWILVFLPPLLRARELAGPLQQKATIAAKYSSLAARDIPALFSTAPSFYGNGPLCFVFLAVVCLGMGGLGFFVLRHGRSGASAWGAAAAAAGLAAPLGLLVHGYLFSVDTAIRYACPVLIGAFVILVLGSLRFARQRAGGQFRPWTLVISGCMVAALALFGGTFWSRMQRAATSRTLLAFPIDAAYQRYSEAMVSPFENSYDYTVQTNMPAGAAALVWMVAPFQLDFSRNQLFSVSEAGIINPALHFPAGADFQSFENYLRALGIRYVLMETNGYAIGRVDRWNAMMKSRFAVYQKLGDFGIYLRQTLLTLAQRNSVRYADDRFLLFELKDRPEATGGAAGTTQAEELNRGNIY